MAIPPWKSEETAFCRQKALTEEDMHNRIFQCKHFVVRQCADVHPVGTDGLLLGAWADVRDIRCALDVGTGTGLIALQLAQRTQGMQPTVHIHAVDLSTAARCCAEVNFRHSPWADRLSVVGDDIVHYAAQAPRSYDLIAVNPPFHTERIFSLQPQRHQSRHAHFLSSASLIKAARQLLSPHGRLCAIASPVSARLLVQQGAVGGLYLTRLTAVCSRPHRPVERYLVQLEQDPYPFERSQVSIWTETGAYAPSYRALTSEFLLDKGGECAGRPVADSGP